MRLVIDTNVPISAPLAGSCLPAHLITLWREGQFDLLTSVTQLDELMRVPRYPRIRKRLAPALAGRLINELRDIAVIVEKLPQVTVCADPYDNYLLAMAAADAADFDRDRRQARPARPQALRGRQDHNRPGFSRNEQAAAVTRSRRRNAHWLIERGHNDNPPRQDIRSQRPSRIRAAIGLPEVIPPNFATLRSRCDPGSVMLSRQGSSSFDLKA